MYCESVLQATVSNHSWVTYIFVSRSFYRALQNIEHLLPKVPQWFEKCQVKCQLTPVALTEINWNWIELFFIMAGDCLGVCHDECLHVSPFGFYYYLSSISENYPSWKQTKINEWKTNQYCQYIFKCQIILKLNGPFKYVAVITT